MASDPTKLAIIRAFDAAAATYDAASKVQREIARELLLYAARACERTPARILDLGCGAGHATEFALRQWPQAQFAVLDAAPKMLEALQGKFSGLATICADAAEPGPLGEYDVILSSMMAHWLPEPRAAVRVWRDLLAPGGKCFIALPVEGSLHEWRDACREAGLADGLWPFPPENFAAGLTEKTEIRAFVASYPDAGAFLQSLKRTGARQARPGHRPESPAALRRLMASRREGFIATFRIAFLTIGAE
ncbi:methyltransferase domain-containing protein [uncultured Rhodoblastus sp.]|uniref:methyltransferase domain-containing protein n=1 Tax=uncultured Rhodoblastus sp. TaxID=543037 RepID=UPI0025DA2971|nr:methyltransferase domain-containing protein [uncultured Rhodoblastus sp.]